MSHHIYRTDAIILRSFPEGESSKFLHVFTRELGLVGASVRSIRENKSKLRYALEDYSVSFVSLVRGKDVWRVVNAVPIWNVYFDLADSPRAREAAERVLSLVRKLVVGEERNAPLYSEVSDALLFLREMEISREETVAFQLLAGIRILNLLGYLGRHEKFDDFLGEGVWTLENLRAFSPAVSAARETVRDALASAHL
jgi:DNA repair protein RecO